MDTMLVAIGAILMLVSLYFQIVIIIAAFKDEVWKGLVSIFCCQLYLLYFALFEFNHEQRGKYILGWLVPGILGGILFNMGSPHSQR